MKRQLISRSHFGFFTAARNIVCTEREGEENLYKIVPLVTDAAFG